jgi:ComF family protein
MRLPFISPDESCEVCGAIVTGLGGETGHVCGECRSSRSRARRFDLSASALRFEDVARKMVLDFKFHSKIYLADDFADWMTATAKARYDVTQIDVVCSMPISLKTRINRGYNQSEYLAARVARNIDRRFDGGILKRVGNPKRQSTLGADERMENVADTIKLVKPEMVRGRTVLVVDDIMTTGASLSECARVLKEAGAWRVWTLCLARAIS